jgi:hypothetical protein
LLLFLHSLQPYTASWLSLCERAPNKTKPRCDWTAYLLPTSTVPRHEEVVGSPAQDKAGPHWLTSIAAQLHTANIYVRAATRLGSRMQVERVHPVHPARILHALPPLCEAARDACPRPPRRWRGDCFVSWAGRLLSVGMSVGRGERSVERGDGWPHRPPPRPASSAPWRTNRRELD